MFGANLVIPSQICDELLCRQAKFPRILSQDGQNYLEGQGQWPQFSIPAESIPGCIFVANLMILAQICDEWCHGRTDCRTDGHTDVGNDNTLSVWMAKWHKWTNWYHFHFYFNCYLMYFQLKTNWVGFTEVSIVPMADNMYSIQWIITSYYSNGYKLYRNNFVCIKIAFI